MPIYKGSNKIRDIYKGNIKIGKVYKGNTLVYQSTLPSIVWVENSKFVINNTWDTKINYGTGFKSISNDSTIMTADNISYSSLNMVFAKTVPFINRNNYRYAKITIEKIVNIHVQIALFESNKSETVGVYNCFDINSSDITTQTTKIIDFSKAYNPSYQYVGLWIHSPLLNEPIGGLCSCNISKIVFSN